MPITPIHQGPEHESEWLTVKEAAEWLGFTTVSQQRAFHRAITLGLIPAIKLNRKTIKLHKDTIRAIGQEAKHVRTRAA